MADIICRIVGGILWVLCGIVLAALWLCALTAPTPWEGLLP